MLFCTTYDYNTEKWDVERITPDFYQTVTEYRIEEKSNHRLIVVAY